jgi:hypothetical protein
MARTILESFRKLKANFEITELQKSTLSTRQQNVRKAVEKELIVSDSFLTGSYSRHTMIAPLKEADVDIFVVLHSDYYEQNGQTNLLDKVRRVLLKTYPDTPKISRNGQAVTITFTDFKVDVVPAFYRKGEGFLIPNSITKRWISTNPKVHVEIMNDENEAHDGDLVPIVKMIKGWNRNINHAFVSFYLELLAVNIFKNGTILDYPRGMRYFFDKGREKIKYKVKDPVNYGENINALDTVSTVKDAVNRFENAYKLAKNAEDDARNGYTAAAIEGWREIFGDYFPSYG